VRFVVDVKDKDMGQVREKKKKKTRDNTTELTGWQCANLAFSSV